MPDPCAVPYLICVGSPEDDFAYAGRVFSLQDLKRVRFGRALTSVLEVETAEGVLHLGIPLAWVSGVHAELILATSDDRPHELKDLLSRNGTAVEGDVFQGSAWLTEGDIFEIGRSFWMVRSSAAHFERRAPALFPTGTCNPVLAPLVAALERLAASDLPVLLTGETGVGKSRLARNIHERSGLRGAFVQINLAASPLEPLLGGSGGQDDDRLTAHAAGGSLFLDEIGELDADAQAQLLKMCSTGAIAAGRVRLLAASSRDLHAMINSDQFRPDLFARLGGYEAKLPALRDRREDLGLLVRDIVSGPKRWAMTVEAFRRVLGHNWPYNVRELVQTLKAAQALTERPGIITRMALDESLPHSDRALSPARVQTVRQELMRALRSHGTDVDTLARRFGTNRDQIQRWLHRFAIRPQDYTAN